jgi:hypothetical protein
MIARSRLNRRTWRHPKRRGEPSARQSPGFASSKMTTAAVVAFETPSHNLAALNALSLRLSPRGRRSHHARADSLREVSTPSGIGYNAALMTPSVPVARTKRREPNGNLFSATMQSDSETIVRQQLAASISQAFDGEPGEPWDPDSEGARVILDWLAADASASSAEKESLLSAARFGRDLYRTFMESFSETFATLPSLGSRYIGRSLHRRFGFTEDRLIEVVLNRIHDRRLHLLAAFYKKYQGSLFAAQFYDPKRLRGYFVQVARIESLHVDLREFCWQSATALDRVTLEKYQENRRDQSASDPRRLLEWATALANFWSRDNRFTGQQRLEGLVSVGLGFLTNEPVVDHRCREYLEKKLPAWECRQADLNRRASRMFAKWEETRDELRFVTDPSRRYELERQLDDIEQRQRRISERMASHPLRLRPKPKDVQRLLEGFVSETYSGEGKRTAKAQE